MTKPAIGGGAKKLLYTLDTMQRMGVGKAAKALTAKNTCKACAYGMGGQRGGMTNELGEFPSVCNKSVQAQSTDIQPAIPHEVFDASASPTCASSPAARWNISAGSTRRSARRRAPTATSRSAGTAPWTSPPQRFAAANPTGPSSIPPAARPTRPASCSSSSPAPAAPTTSTTAPTIATRRPARALADHHRQGHLEVELEDLTGCRPDLRHRRQSGVEPSALHPHAEGLPRPRRRRHRHQPGEGSRGW